MKVIFLDIDGVLNDGHAEEGAAYCGIQRPLVGRLNRILHAVPDCQLVISSSWRYFIFAGHMTITGFEVMLAAAGVHCRGRVHGHTESDEKCCVPQKLSDDTWYDRTRAKQIEAYIDEHSILQYVVLDDMVMDIPNLLLTNCWEGLTDEIVDKAIELLV